MVSIVLNMYWAHEQDKLKAYEALTCLGFVPYLSSNGTIVHVNSLYAADIDIFYTAKKSLDLIKTVLIQNSTALPDLFSVLAGGKQ